MPKRGNADRHRLAYLWNEEIAEKRKTCIQRRRLFQRAETRDKNGDHEREAWWLSRKELRIAIRVSQGKAWKQLINDVETDAWGLLYKIVTKKLNRRPPGALTTGRKVELAAELFPRLVGKGWRLPVRVDSWLPSHRKTTHDSSHSRNSSRWAAGFPAVRRPRDQILFTMKF